MSGPLAAVSINSEIPPPSVLYTGGNKPGRKHSDALQWRHNEHDSVSNHQPRDCLLNRLFGRRSKKTSKLRVTGLCVGNSPGAGEFPAQRASYAENASIWWRHHDTRQSPVCNYRSVILTAVRTLVTFTWVCRGVSLAILDDMPSNRWNRILISRAHFTKGLEISNRNLMTTNFAAMLHVYASSQVKVLHMSWQFTCLAMCKNSDLIR